MKVLLVEDEKILRISLEKSLKKEGYKVTSCDDGEEALNILSKNKFDIVLTDIQLPKADGFAILDQVVKNNKKIKVIMMTAYGSIEAAVKALKIGAYDYITKPFTKEELFHRIEKIKDLISVLDENKKLKKALKINRTIVGEDSTFQKTIEQVNLAAPTDHTILVEGASGTGKELIVELIHNLSSRSSKPLIKVNCSALSETLFESELFGHEKGAFTGAHKQNIGRFERANGGTLFLDDIDDLPTEMQVKLLRVIQEGEIERVGGTKTIPVDVRLVVATKVDLEKEVEVGRFRDDFYYRINVVRIEIPPLSDRKSDIPLLVNHFLKKHGQNQKVSPEAMEIFMQYDWPGNVRELENLIVQMIATSQNDLLDKNSLPNKLISTTNSGKTPSGSLTDNLSNSERELIVKALEKCKWRQKEAAELLKIPRTTLRSKMKKYEII